MTAVLQKLESLAINDQNDVEYLKESNLTKIKGLLKPVEARKLINFWESATIIQVCTLNQSIQFQNL